MRKEERKHIVDFFDLYYRLAIHKRIKGKIEQVLCVEPEDNKYFQNTARQFSEKTFYGYVKSLREKRYIDINYFNNQRRKWDELANRKQGVSDRIAGELDRQGYSLEKSAVEYINKSNELEMSLGYDKAKAELNNHQEKCIEWADKRLTFKDVDQIRVKFDFPPNWENSIIHYIFTGELLMPDLEHYQTIYRNGGEHGFKITLYADSTDDRLRVLYQRIRKLKQTKATVSNKFASRDIYKSNEVRGKIDSIVIEISGFPTVRRLIAISRRCQKKKMRGAWLRKVRVGGNLKNQFQKIEEFEQENPPGKMKDGSTNRWISVSARSITNPRQYARIRKLKERLKDKENIFV